MNLVEVYRKTDLLKMCTTKTSLNTYGIDEGSSVLPHLGERYQAEISTLIEQMPMYVDLRTDFNFCTSEELTIPLMWARHPHYVAGPLGHLQEDNLNDYQTVPCATACGGEISDSQLEDGERSARKGYVPFPDSPKASWSDSESQSFLLGLYIFGKDLVLVQRFVGSKDMGDVLSFYYGRFYRSNAQRKWVECRKNKSRMCIFGHRIFTGRRQQKLLLRLLPRVSKEVQEILLEVTKAFNMGAASLEEFIFTLKNITGPEALVEAIAIGKGKQDLTALASNPIRTNQIVSTRSKIPVGREWSSLTSEEIVMFLTGDFRFSKAKSDDLFWEAVWPRLLARGWHSEQPKDAAKNFLVFLMPGVKKFSRRKLTKGDDYFDSVSDVLNKVALEPGLLELEVEEGKGSDILNEVASESRMLELAVEESKERDGINNEKPGHLHPRLHSYYSNVTKFPVFDTCLVNGDSSTEEPHTGCTSLQCQDDSDRSLSDDKNDANVRLPRKGHDILKRKRWRLSSRKHVGIDSHSFCAEEEQFHMESLKTNKELAGEDKKNEEQIKQEIKAQPRTLIDLNLDPTNLESEGAEIVLPDEKNPGLDGRRQGTRNRPPTVKALEAFACGFLRVRKEKGMKISRRAHKNVKSLLDVSNASTLSNPKSSITVPSVRKDTCELLGFL